MFLRILDRLEEILITSLMLGATVLIFVAVIHRYAAGVPLLYPYAIMIDLGWAQELCQVRRRLRRAHRCSCRR